MSPPASHSSRVSVVGSQTDISRRLPPWRDWLTKLMDPERLAALAATGLLESQQQEEFDAWTRLAARLLDVPVALISFLDDHRQVLKSFQGLSGEWAERREVPLSHSVCKYVVAAGEPLVLDDVRESAALRSHPGVQGSGVVAYLGVPLSADGQAVGTFCVFDTEPRAWNEDEIAMLAEFGRAIETQIALSITNAELAERERLLNAVLNLMPAGVVVSDVGGGVLRSNPAMAKILGRGDEEITGRAFSTFLHLEDAADNAAQRERLFRDETAVVPTRTLRCLGGEGRVVWVRMSESLLRDPQGVVHGTIAVIEDVSAEREAAEAIAHQARVYHAIAQNIPRGAVLMFDHDFRYIAADGPELLAAAGLDKRRLEGHTLSEVARAENLPALQAIYAKALAGQSSEFEAERNGRRLMSRIAPIWNADRVSAGLVFVQDVTEERQQQAAVRRSKSLFEATISNIRDGVALLDPNFDVLLANAAFAEMLALDEVGMHQLNRTRFLAHLSELVDDREALLASMGVPEDSTPARVDEIILARPRRRVLRRTRSELELPDGTGKGYLVIWQDITAERELSHAREREALSDVLTGIPNRRAAERALAIALACSDRAGTPLSVALFDVDHFKRINDAFGHARGDEVLKHVAACLAREARSTDTVARWGGEEFIALLPVPLTGAVAFCERVRKAIEAVDHPGVGSVTVSAGVAEFGDKEAPEGALSRADGLLYAAKAAGRNRVSG